MSTAETTTTEDEENVSVLVVDDEPSVLRAWRRILSAPRYTVTLLQDPVEADAKLEQLAPDVAVIDIRMPEMDGMELLSRIKSRSPHVEVVMMTGFGGVEDAVEAIKRGAYDFLTKPFESLEAPELAIRRAAKVRRLERRVLQLEQQRMMEGKATSRVIGRSPAILRVLELVRSIAASQSTVLIIGDSGTGKDLIAQAVHETSQRTSTPLVTINCAALPEALLESELFGHVKGAFTGANNDHQGLFQAADGGTLFLDEIGDMSLPTQAKLLRTLQEGEVRPVGSNRTLTVDVRVIAATNVDLEERVADKLFREDLYYRLNVIRIDVPPLRERGDDIALLAQHFLLKHQKAVDRQFEGVDARALEALFRYDWRGNVRELENVIERAVAVSRGKRISLEDMPPRIVAGARPTGRATAVTLEADIDRRFAEAKKLAIERFERSYLRLSLDRHRTVAAAARAAGLDRANFRRLLRRHELTGSSVKKRGR